MNDYLPAAIVAWFLSASLLAIEHFYCRRLPRLIRYILGTIALGFGTTAGAIILDDVLLGIFPWFIASSGIVVILLYWGEDQFKRAKAGGQHDTDTATIARRLQQELLDKERGDAQSRRHGSERLN